jgi:hypothetical protein
VGSDRRGARWPPAQAVWKDPRHALCLTVRRGEIGREEPFLEPVARPTALPWTFGFSLLLSCQVQIVGTGFSPNF